MIKLIAVIVGCFAFGYWLVAVLLPNLKRDPQDDTPYDRDHRD